MTLIEYSRYCANLRKGDILTPRFCFYKIPLNTFKCVLSMPINGPIKEDITVSFSFTMTAVIDSSKPDI